MDFVRILQMHALIGQLWSGCRGRTLLKYANTGPGFGAPRAEQIGAPPSIQMDLRQPWCDQNALCE